MLNLEHVHLFPSQESSKRSTGIHIKLGINKNDQDHFWVLRKRTLVWSSNKIVSYEQQQGRQQRNNCGSTDKRLCDETCAGVVSLCVPHVQMGDYWLCVILRASVNKFNFPPYSTLESFAIHHTSPQIYETHNQSAQSLKEVSQCQPPRWFYFCVAFPPTCPSERRSQKVSVKCSYMY